MLITARKAVSATEIGLKWAISTTEASEMPKSNTSISRVKTKKVWNV